jgi:hypothetical protein
MYVTPELEGRIEELKGLEKELEKTLPKHSLKWNYPQNVVQNIQINAEVINKHFCKELEQLLHWPRTKQLEKDGVPYKDAQGFYDKNWEERFSRTTQWFGEMGFSKHETPYTFTDNWDKAYINATFLIPENLKSGDKVPVMWFFHGGGFVSNDFVHPQTCSLMRSGDRGWRPHPLVLAIGSQTRLQEQSHSHRPRLPPWP